MAISSVSSTNPLDQLAKSLVDRFDANGDGQLTTQEFTSFLTNFINSVAPGATVNAAAVNATATQPLRSLGGSAPAMSGFSATKLADTSHDTLKYRFGRVAQRYSLDSVTDKASAEALLTSMKSDLEAAGVQVLEIKKDKFKTIGNSGNEVWVDVIKAAGSGRGAAWQWMDAD
jgi:hypothetical protein